MLRSRRSPHAQAHSVLHAVSPDTVSQEQSALINQDLHATQLVIICLIEIYLAVAPLACHP